MLDFMRPPSLLLMLVMSAVSMASSPPAEDKPARKLGSETCGQSVCHGAGQAWLGAAVGQDEYRLWHDRDPHRKAGVALAGPRATRMTALLGMGLPSGQPLCLGCHAPGVVPDKASQEGVGCEACHGASKAWIGTHATGIVSHADNLAAGLYPNEQPAARAQLCLSCHSYDGKRLTHRLLAAGHPQLRHDFASLYTQWPKHHVDDADYRSRKHPAPESQYLQAGITEAASRWIDGLAQSQGLRSGGLPELSFFQCDDCHHPQGQGAQASRGVPRLATGPLKALAAQGAYAKGNGQFIEHSKELEAGIQTGRDALLQALRNLSADVPAQPRQTTFFP